MAQTIGFIGVGPINGTWARFAANAGLDVIASNSRGPDTLSGEAGDEEEDDEDEGEWIN